MTYIEIATLGIIQGITEFLPVSSSAHLSLAQIWLNHTQDIIFLDICLHFGSLIAIILFYFDRIKGFVKFTILNPTDLSEEYGFNFFHLIIGCLPVVIFGLIMGEKIDSIFQSKIWIACFLVITGTFLFSTKYVNGQNENLSIKKAFLIGFVQCLALFPGISRSGSTIAMGMFLGVKDKTATEFSFYMVIPLLIGAPIYKLMTESLPENISLVIIITGVFVSFFASFIALKWLNKIIKKQKLHRFSYYCWLLGILIIGANL